jgi:hypothetical protein
MSGNVCAFSDPERAQPACEQRLADPSWEAVQAIICHIHGWSQGGPRFIEMPDEERNAFENLMLLCPNHSNLVDRLEPERYPAEKLRVMKAKHEGTYAVGTAWEPDDEDLRRFVHETEALTRLWLTLLRIDQRGPGRQEADDRIATETTVSPKAASPQASDNSEEHWSVHMEREAEEEWAREEERQRAPSAGGSLTLGETMAG